MEPIALFTGSRRRISRRMALSRVRNGRLVKNISEIGAITAKKASASSSIRMETSTKVCGLWINAMVRVLTGKMRATN